MFTCQVKVSLTGRLLTEESVYLAGTHLNCQAYMCTCQAYTCTCQAYTYTCQAFASGLPARFTICLSGLLLLLYLELFKQHTQTWPSWPGMAKSLTPPTNHVSPPTTHSLTQQQPNARLPCCVSPSPAVSPSKPLTPARSRDARCVTSPTPPRDPSHTPRHLRNVYPTLTRYLNGDIPRGVATILLSSPLTTSSNAFAAHTEHRQATHLKIRTRRHAIVYIQLSAFTRAGKMRWGR